MKSQKSKKMVKLNLETDINQKAQINHTLTIFIKKLLSFHNFIMTNFMKLVLSDTIAD